MIDPGTLLNPRPLAPGVAQATMKQPLDTLSCATIRVSSAARLPRAGGGSTRSWACFRVQSPLECRDWTEVSQSGSATLPLDSAILSLVYSSDIWVSAGVQASDRAQVTRSCP